MARSLEHQTKSVMALTVAALALSLFPGRVSAQSVTGQMVSANHAPDSPLGLLPDAPTPSLNEAEQTAQDSATPGSTAPAQGAQPQTGQSGSSSSSGQAQGTAAPQGQQTPANQSGEPSLSDLGLTTGQTQGSAQQQALLDRRTHMLKVHQRLGLLTTIPLAATLVSSGFAKTKKGTTESNTPGLDTHAALGGVALGMYAATAYYAIRAPRIPGAEKKKGAIRLHEALIWIHGPGMILTPILGVMAFNQENNGQHVHGVASAHGAVADVTIAAYVASIISVSWPIKLPW